MKNFKRRAMFLVAIAFFAVTLSTCEKLPIDEKIDISFDIRNLTDNLKKDALPNPYEAIVPICNDDVVPEYAMVHIKGMNIPYDEEIKLDILNNLTDGNLTEVLKLDKGDYAVITFDIYALNPDYEPSADENDSGLDDLKYIRIWASPKIGSDLQVMWNLDGVSGTVNGNPVYKKFTVGTFLKDRVHVDVLCWEQYYYEYFGYSWFECDPHELKTICFIGADCECVEVIGGSVVDDICRDWNDLFNNIFDKHSDIPQQKSDDCYIEYYMTLGNFKVTLLNDNGNVSDIFDGSQFENPCDVVPLCMSGLLHDQGQEETYSFEIHLWDDATGDYTELFEVMTIKVTDTGVEVVEGSGELIKGIYYFDYGNCDCVCEPTTTGGCETAFAHFDKINSEYKGYVFAKEGKHNPEGYPVIKDIKKTNRWGWAGYIEHNNDFNFTIDLIAGAGNNVVSNGTDVGDVTFSRTNGLITVDYIMHTGYSLSEVHIYVNDKAPKKSAPGQYGFIDMSPNTPPTYEFNRDGKVWLIAHAVVCGSDLESGCVEEDDPNIPLTETYYSYFFEFEDGRTAQGTSTGNIASGVIVGDYSMDLHISCSDGFVDSVDGVGYGEKDDPSISKGHPRVTSYKIWKYKIDSNNDTCEFERQCSGEPYTPIP